MTNQRCFIDDDCPWEPGYPTDYRDPSRQPGENDETYYARVFAKRGEAIQEALTTHMQTHHGFENARFEYE